MPATKKRKSEAGDKWIPLAALLEMSDNKATPIYLRQHDAALRFVMNNFRISFPVGIGVYGIPHEHWEQILDRDLFEYMDARPNIPSDTIYKFISDSGHEYCNAPKCWCQRLYQMGRKRSSHSFSYAITRISRASAGLLTFVVDKIMIRRQSIMLLLCARKWTKSCPFYMGNGVDIPTTLVPLEIFKYILALSGLLDPMILIDKFDAFLPHCIPPEEHPDDPDYDDDSDASDSGSGYAGASDDSE